MPILGIYAGSVQKASTAFDSIASSSPTTGTSLTFSSIPSTYQHLQIRGLVRNDRNNGSFPFGNLSIYFNGNDNSGGNAEHLLRGDGSSVTASGSTGIAACTIGSTATNAQTSNVFTAFIIDIHDYRSTTKNKTIRSFIGTDVNGTGRIELSSSLYLATPAAITSITIENYNSANWVTGTTFALYGIKGS